MTLPTYKDVSLGEGYVVKGRKDHRCDLCSWMIPKGDPHWSWRIPPGEWDTWFVGHAHAICREVYFASDWPTYDEALPDPGEFRGELLALVASISRGDVEWIE